MTAGEFQFSFCYLIPKKFDCFYPFFFADKNLKRPMDAADPCKNSDSFKKSKIQTNIKLNSKYTDDSFMLKFKENWKNCKTGQFENPFADIHSLPFKISILQEFLENSGKIDGIVNEMTNVNWTRKQLDLYEFYQTADLVNEDRPHLKEFYSMLKTEVRPWIEKLTDTEISHVSASCSMYNNGDHLLVHDDLLEDRLIAYVFYMSPWPNVEQWTEEMGGALELFGCQTDDGQPMNPILKSILPKNNQFVFFDVSQRSFHQVGEVTTLNYPRLTINGWFHGQRKTPLDSKLQFASLDDPFSAATPNQVILSELINDNYLSDAIKQSIQKHIEMNSEACLESFFAPQFVDAIFDDLQNAQNLKWITQGPLNQRNYETLSLENLSGPIAELITAMSSEAWFKLLYEFTELDLWGPAANDAKCSIKLCRVTQGSYSLLGSFAKKNNSLDVILYFNVRDNVGLITYLNPDEDTATVSPKEHSDSDEDVDNDSVLLTIQPKENALNLVYRSDGTSAFIKYISKNCIPKNEYSYILLASYRE